MAILQAPVKHEPVQVGDQDVDPAVAIEVTKEDTAAVGPDRRPGLEPVVVEPGGIEATRSGHFPHEGPFRLRHLALHNRTLLEPAPFLIDRFIGLREVVSQEERHFRRLARGRLAPEPHLASPPPGSIERRPSLRSQGHEGYLDLGPA